MSLINFRTIPNEHNNIRLRQITNLQQTKSREVVYLCTDRINKKGIPAVKTEIPMT